MLTRGDGKGEGFLQPTTCFAFGVGSQLQGEVKRKSENMQLQAADQKLLSTQVATNWVRA